MDRRRFRAVAWTLAVACLYFAASLTIATADPGTPCSAKTLALTAAPLFAAWSCLSAARRATIARRGWWLLGMAAAAWALGQLLWTWQIWVDGTTLPFPSIADAGRLASLPLAAAGVLALQQHDGVPGVRIRTALDCAVVAGSLFILGWFALFGPILDPAATSLEIAIVLAYPVCDVVAAAIVLLSVGRARPQGRVALGLVAAGLGLLVIADGFFGYWILSGTFPGHRPLATWFTGFALLALAALAPAGPDAAVWTPRERGTSVLLPYLLFLAATSTFVVGLARGTPPSAVSAATGLAVLALVTARLLLAVRENQTLLLELRAREEHFRSLVQHSSDLITLVGPDGTVRYQSPSVTRVLGYAPDELVGAPLATLLHPDDAPSTLSALHDEDASGTGKPIETRLRHARGGWRHVESTLTHRDGLERGGLVITTRDVSERKELERQLSHQAFHDALTGLANRTLFADRAEHAIAGHRRDRAGVGILYVDLDDFKTVNDSLGHAAGDELLVAVAKRLSALSRPGDTVARLGGDEFALLVPGVGLAELTAVAGRIAEAMAQPFTLAGREAMAGASIGLATADEAVVTATDLLRNADLAMYEAKRRGKGRWEPFEHAMHAKVLRRMQLEEDLRRALDGDEFVVHYQPIVALGDGHVTGVEALVRWQHPISGLLSPASFLGTAEDAGLLPVLGRRVLERACHQVSTWHRRLPCCHGLALHVNVSARQLRDPGLPAAIAGALRISSLPAGRLVLEVPERAFADGIAGRLAELRSLGIRLAIDGFGAGGSSLADLKRHPVDMVKLDPLFVEGLAENPELARAVFELGRTLRIATVATGVQRTADLRVLGELGCELGQGHSLARPQPPDQIEGRLILPTAHARAR